MFTEQQPKLIHFLTHLNISRTFRIVKGVDSIPLSSASSDFTRHRGEQQ